MVTNKKLAPVALFVYDRLHNTIEVIEALKKNSLSRDTDLFIYSDAPRLNSNKKNVYAVREYLKKISGFKTVNIIEREENYYIEKNIIEGVTELINKFGRIIVLEDDGVTAPNFLNFMNRALDFYGAHERVMHIATFTFIILPASYKERKTFFWRYTENGGGGWATWADRWDKFKYFDDEIAALASLSEDQKLYLEMEGGYRCLGLLKLKPIPWDICWYMSVVRSGGLALQTPCALTKNNGLYNGTHFSPISRLFGRSMFHVDLGIGNNLELTEIIEEDIVALEILKSHYKLMNSNKRARLFMLILNALVYLKVTKVIKWVCKKLNLL